MNKKFDFTPKGLGNR